MGRGGKEGDGREGRERKGRVGEALGPAPTYNFWLRHCTVCKNSRKRTNDTERHCCRQTTVEEPITAASMAEIMQLDDGYPTRPDTVKNILNLRPRQSPAGYM